MAQELDPELMKILVCPETHAPLVRSGDWLYSTDEQSRRKYPIRDGIPIMLIDDSEVADESEFRQVMQQAQENAQNG